MTESTPPLVPAVDRAFRMLATLKATDQGRRISELARDLGIPKSSAHQIATTLVHHGVLERSEETQRYRLGPGLSDMVAHRRFHVVLPKLAGRYLEALASSARMTALLGLWEGDQVVLAAKVESPDPIDVSAPIGHRLDARTGVFGKLLDAAGLPDDPDRSAPGDVLERPPPSFAGKNVVDAGSYAEELRFVCEHGYALDVEEYLEGVVAVGAAVRDDDGNVVGALCLIGLAVSYSRSELAGIGEKVRVAAESLSRDTGLDHAPQRRDPLSSSAGR